MRFRPITFVRYFTVCAILIALTAVGFAHRLDRGAASPELAAYVAAGGDLADLCGTDGQGGKLGSSCDACRIVDATVILRTTCGTTTAHTLRTQNFAFVATEVHRRHPHDPARLTRAPPQA